MKRFEHVWQNRIEEILVSNSSLVSGLSEASGVKFSLVEVPQESQTNKKRKHLQTSANWRPIDGLLGGDRVPVLVPVPFRLVSGVNESSKH